MRRGVTKGTVGEWTTRRLVTTVALVALVARAVVAVVLNLTDTWSLAPDAGLYLEVAETANHRGLDEFRSGYGKSFYRSTWTYTSQIAAGFRLLGEHRLIGQAISLAYGTVVAGLVTAMAIRMLSRRAALGVGMVVALLPSQVVWSTVVLRESTIWAALAVAGLLLVRFCHIERRMDAVVLGTGLAFTYIALVFLRSQTAFLSLWCSVAAVLVGSGRRGMRCILAVSLIVVPPLVVGRGVGDGDIVRNVVGKLGTVRAYMSMDAESALVELEVITTTPAPARDTISPEGTTPPEVSGVVDPEVVTTTPAPSRDTISPEGTTPPAVSEPPAVDGLVVAQGESPGSTLVVAERPSVVIDRASERVEGGQEFVIARNGQAVAVHNQLSASVSAFPSGLLAVALRPFPWEERTSVPRMLAGLESGLWACLYVLAGVGVWRRRQEFAALAFPFLFTLSFLVTGAVTQGNLGTAFRHRGQIVWAIALMAGIGCSLVSRSLNGGPGGWIRSARRWDQFR